MASVMVASSGLPGKRILVINQPLVRTRNRERNSSGVSGSGMPNSFRWILTVPFSKPSCWAMLESA